MCKSVCSIKLPAGKWYENLPYGQWWMKLCSIVYQRLKEQKEIRLATKTNKGVYLYISITYISAYVLWEGSLINVHSQSWKYRTTWCPSAALLITYFIFASWWKKPNCHYNTVLVLWGCAGEEECWALRLKGAHPQLLEATSPCPAKRRGARVRQELLTTMKHQGASTLCNGMQKAFTTRRSLSQKDSTKKISIWPAFRKPTWKITNVSPWEVIRCSGITEKAKQREELPSL